jgi:N6-adenosine-specific RNA methylase IME4
MSRYSIIYADPPWSYRDKAHAGERGVLYKYDLMDLGQIKRLPVQDLAADNCALFLWVTPPLLPDCLTVVEAWGFKYKTVGFTWVKTYRGSDNYFMGMGSYTRTNAELCLLAFKGKLTRVHKGVRSLVVSPVRQHSQKPDEVRNRIVQLFGDVPRIELFARQRSPGWDAWGNQTTSDVELVDGKFVPVAASAAAS